MTSMNEGDVLFIDEIHRIKPVLEEMLYIAMEDFAIDMVMGD
jgi:holliday junction DNA helicase RuvB